LFFPLHNFVYLAFPVDDDTSVEFARAQVAHVKGSVSIVAEIDGTSVIAPLNYYEDSAVFAITAPEELASPNGRPTGEVWTPGVDAGYYLFLNPLTPGQHTITFISTFNDPAGKVSQNLRYTVIVKPGK
jgi:hypothetical protein